MEANVAPTVFAATFVKNSRTSEAAISTPPESCSLERKGKARTTGMAAQQAQRFDLVGPIRLAIHGNTKSWKMSNPPPHTARTCNSRERGDAKEKSERGK